MPSGTTVYPLLADGALVLDFAVGLAPLVDRWLPAFTEDDGRSAPSSPAAMISARLASPASVPAASDPPTFKLASVACRVDAAAERAHLRGASPAISATIDLSALLAMIEVDPDSGAAPRARDLPEGRQKTGNSRVSAPARVGLKPEAAESGSPDVGVLSADMFSMLTISSALLLGRTGRTLLHAGAVAGPGGGAWLLAGDSHSGKTTTALNLARAGWTFLSDDHVVLARERDTITVEGWPRVPHVDEGWQGGEITGRRIGVSLAALGLPRRVRQAPLEGVLLPSVVPEGRTNLTRSTGGHSLEKLIRQSPWMLADRVAAPAILAILRESAALPAFTLSLGRDSYGSPERLADVLSGLRS